MTLVGTFDLPAEDDRARELSAIAWDDALHSLFAVSDERPWIIPLVPNPRFDGWTFGEPIPVAVSDHWDGEGIALTGGSFFLANERGPHVYQLDRNGALRSELALESRFDTCIPNKCVESLSLSPDGRFLFYANESALTVDGAQPTAERGTTIRIVRHDRETGDNAVWAYRTEPIFSAAGGGDMGVSDLTAWSPDELLVLERSYVPKHGVSARIFHVLLDASDAQGESLFNERRVLKKTLLVDLANLDYGHAPSSPASNPRIPNYEGMALGPPLATGERLLFLISDDNANRSLPARVLTLRVSVNLARELLSN